MIHKKEPIDGLFIGDCPNEVLKIIFSNLPAYTLKEIAIVHERFKAVALPLVYRSIQLIADFRSDNQYSSVQGNQLPAGLVTQIHGPTLRSYPGFYRLVQSLDLEVQNANWYTNAGGHRRLMELLPSLKELSLQPPAKIYNIPINEQLRTMKLNFPFDFGRFGTSASWSPIFDLNEYLSKPALRKIQFNNVEDGLSHRMIHTGTSRSSTIMDLRLINWYLEDVQILARVLPSIRHLKYFVLEVNREWLEHESRPPVQGLGPYDFGRLLQPHTASLEQIVVAYSPKAYSEVGHFPLQVSPVIGSLTAYHSLRRLAIPEPFLVPSRGQSIYQILPPCLQEIQIQYPWVPSSAQAGEFDPANELTYRLVGMQSLADNKQEFLPQLKRVVSWFQKPESGTNLYTYNSTQASKDSYESPTSDYKKSIARLAKQFRKVNVDFEVVLTLNIKDTPFAEYMHIQ